MNRMEKYNESANDVLDSETRCKGIWDIYECTSIISRLFGLGLPWTPNAGMHPRMQLEPENVQF